MGTGSLLALGVAALAAGALVLVLGAPSEGAAPALAVVLPAASAVEGVPVGDLPRHRVQRERRALMEKETVAPSEVSTAEAPLAPTPTFVRPEWPLRGVIVDRAGLLEAYEVTCRGRDSHFETTTDASGSFQLDLPGPGDYWFTIEAPGRRLVQHKKVLAAGSFLHFLFDGNRVGGRVLDSRGGPLTGVDVRLEWRPSEAVPSVGAFPSKAITDELGRFTFEHVPAGRFCVRVRGHSEEGLHYAAARCEPFIVVDDSLPEEHVFRLELTDSPPASSAAASRETARRLLRRRRR